MFESCPKCATPVVSVATTNTNYVVETQTPDKKLTPMAKLIDRIKPLIGKYGIEADAMITTVIQEATSLLPAEREMGESAWDDAYAVGCVVGGNDYTNEQDEDTGFHYFTQNYQQ